MSPSVRREWIEIVAPFDTADMTNNVSLRPEGVD